jgi:hypothetical protein
LPQNDLQASTGTILFGGIDTEKYYGNLIAVPIEPDAQTKAITSFTVTLSTISLTDTNGTSTNYSTSAVPVILDSGTTFSYLPTDLVNRLYKTFDIYDDLDNTQVAYVDCSYARKQELTLDFQFGGDDGPLIKVPMDELVLDNLKQYIPLGFQPPSDLPFTDICQFGIWPDSQVYLLGDTFLRSAYVVYDLASNEIALAQSNLNSTESNIVEIKANSTQIPEVTGVAIHASVTQTATGIPGKGDDSSMSTMPASASETSETSETSGTSKTTGISKTSGTSGASGTSSTAAASSSGNVAPRGISAPGWEAVGVAAIVTMGSMLGSLLFVL